MWSRLRRSPVHQLRCVQQHRWRQEYCLGQLHEYVFTTTYLRYSTCTSILIEMPTGGCICYTSEEMMTSTQQLLHASLPTYTYATISLVANPSAPSSSTSSPTIGANATYTCKLGSTQDSSNGPPFVQCTASTASSGTWVSNSGACNGVLDVK